jgi:site-specific recombinase XerD
VPIDAVLEAVLRDLRKVRSIAGDAREFVFTWCGERISSVKTSFETARDGSGLGPEVGLHTLRHTSASWFMINGGDLYRLQKFLGHSAIKLTERYAHLSPEYLKGGARFFGAPVPVEEAEAAPGVGGHPVAPGGQQR